MSEAPIRYIADFLKGDEAEEIFRHLSENLAWVDVTPRRREYWTNTLNRPYTYGSKESARTYQPQPADPVVDRVTDTLAGLLGFRYEACFLNQYLTGKNALSWHADDDPSIDHSKPIAVVTLYDGPVHEVVQKQTRGGQKVWVPIKPGAGARLLQVKPILGGKDSVQTISVGQGSLTIMGPGMQDTHLHQIPGAGGYQTRPRISLTYRSLRYEHQD